MTDNNKCQCGRDLMPPHCVRCGSRSIYSREASGTVVEVDGVRRFAPGFHCRACALDFNVTEPCTAKPRKVSVADAKKIREAQAKEDAMTIFMAQRAEIIADPNLDDLQKKDRINELMRGLVGKI